MGRQWLGWTDSLGGSSGNNEGKLNQADAAEADELPQMRNNEGRQETPPNTGKVRGEHFRAVGVARLRATL